ncbi:MAG: PEGA domain-containing protein [Candidatus Acidiferrales bacterium]
MKVTVRTLLVGTVLVLLAGPAAWAQEEEGPQPISQAEFIALVNAKTPPEQLLADIRARGVSFKLTPEFEADLKGAKVKKEVIDLLKAPATLEIHANVGGAEVTLDTEPRGTLSPDGTMVVPDLEPGSHLVRLRAEGYVPAQASAFLKPEEKKRLEVTLTTAVSTTAGPLGIRVNIAAGTMEDAAFAELEFEKDPQARAQKLEAIIQRYGPESPLTLLAYGMLQQAYLSGEFYSEAEAAGNELLKRDPRSFDGTVRQARAALGQGKMEEALTLAGRARRLLQELDQAPAPAGTSADAWAAQKRRLAEASAADLETLGYDLLIKGTEVTDPARKGKFMEGYLQTFPDSPYRGPAYVNLAVAAQQQGDVAGMVKWSEEGLKAFPTHGILMVMAASTLVERGSSGAGPTRQDLNRARELGDRLLELLTKEPEKVPLPGATEEERAGMKQLWEGVAHLVLGQVALHEGSTDPPVTAKIEKAISEFKTAGPMLKADTGSYARNQFLLGFAYAKLGDAASAREVLNEVVALGTPYTDAARDLLGKLGTRRR